jgi:hypothetical protein
MVLAILGVVCLLLNPAGICAGTPSVASPSHPCCPKPPSSMADQSCVCIDRQPAAPTLPDLSVQTHSLVIESDAIPGAAILAQVPDFPISDASPPAAHSILLSIHQLLL